MLYDVLTVLTVVSAQKKQYIATITVQFHVYWLSVLLLGVSQVVSSALLRLIAPGRNWKQNICSTHR